MLNSTTFLGKIFFHGLPLIVHTSKGNAMSHNDPTSFSSRLRQRREQLGIRKHDLATNIGVSLTTIQQYENGQMPRGELAVRLGEALDCSLDWLLAGRGHDDCNTSASGDRLVFVPMVEARLTDDGTFANNAEHVPHYAFRWDFLHSKGNPSFMVLLRVAGDSMSPNILNNDVVLIDQSQTTTMPGYIYAISVEDMVYLKVVDAVPGKLLLSSINSEYSTIEVDTTKQMQKLIRIVGRAIWTGRELG